MLDRHKMMYVGQTAGYRNNKKNYVLGIQPTAYDSRQPRYSLLALPQPFWALLLTRHTAHCVFWSLSHMPSF